MIQRTPEWFEARKGRFTASSIYKLMTNPRSKSEAFSTSAISYINEKVAEVITGQIKGFTNKYVEHGTFWEPHAFALANQYCEAEVIECGFFTHGSDAGASPDGLIDDSGILELKCPYNDDEHQKYLMFKTWKDLFKEKKEYYYQMQLQMLCTDRDYGVFFTYSPFYHPFNGKKLMVPRDKKVIADMDERIEKAAIERDRMINAIMRSGAIEDPKTVGITRESQGLLYEFKVEQ